MKVDVAVDVPGFLALSERNQLRAIRGMKMEAAKDLLDRCENSEALFSLADEHFIAVHAALLEKVNPEEYHGLDLVPEIREALTPEAERERRKTEFRFISALIHRSPENQLVHIRGLSSGERAELVDRLDRYARQHGRTRRVENLEQLVRENL